MGIETRFEPLKLTHMWGLGFTKRLTRYIGATLYPAIIGLLPAKKSPLHHVLWNVSTSNMKRRVLHHTVQ